MTEARSVSQAIVVLAGVAAGSSLLTLLAATYLWPPRSRANDRGTCRPPLSAQQQQHPHYYGGHSSSTPEPPYQPQPSTSQPGGAAGPLFSPINTQKRPDPYDARPRNTYLSWDDYFMALAFLSAERSKDPNKQVGACIVNDENIILSIGYNGFPRGCADSALPWSKRAASGSILDTKYPYVVHAEANALLNKNQAHVTGARIYVTLFPCNECAKLLIQAGIKEVIFHEAKLEPTGRRPATMERAAEADAAVDRLEEEQAAAATGCQHCHAAACNGSQAESSGCGSSSADAQSERTQQQATAAAAAQKKKFGVGASDDVDASYAASQRLLTLAGVKLRQHRLQRSIYLGP